MRFAMVAMWLRAAASHPEGRATALAYAVGIAVVQVLWIARLLLAGPRGAARVVLRAASSSSCSCRSWPSGAASTPFHPHHIAERYALLTLIVLGEVILARCRPSRERSGRG